MDGLRPDFLPDRSLTEDERAIEGLPIRLVIALVVGIAALAIMMGLLNGLPSLQDEEMSVEFPDDPVVEDDGEITMTAIGPNGEPISDATVLVESGSAELNTTYYETTGSDGNVTVDFGTDVAVEWTSNQDSGKVTINLEAPGDSDYSDGSSNNQITVIRTGP